MLPLFEEYVYRPPATMLSDRGIGVPDDLRSVEAIPTFWRTQRAVAETIGLGAWCDPLAWAEIVNPPCGDLRAMGKCARRGPSCRFCAQFAGEVDADEDAGPDELPWDLDHEPGPYIVDTNPL